jgi:hypothetical protein
MGFDLFIHLSLMMDAETGKPFYYNENYEKVFGIPSIEVPEELRTYLKGRGHHFHVYTEKFNRKDIFEVSVTTFLERYPSWNRFMQSDYFEEDPEAWTREDHKNFKKLLKFLEAQRGHFTVSWSY